MKLRLEVIVLIALFIVLGFFVAYSAEQSGQRTLDARVTSYSSNKDGALALYRWLTRMNGQVDRLAYRPFSLNPDDGLLLVLGPSERYQPAQVEAVVEWVKAGGVLVVADDVPSPQSTVTPLLAAFGLKLIASEQRITTAAVLHPALGAPPVAHVPAHTRAVLDTTAPLLAFAPLAADGAATIVAGQRFGDGYVFALSSVYPFTNQGLRKPESAALVLNLLRWLPPGERIVFDEFHHGFGPSTDLRSLLLSNPLGWAILYSVAMVGLYIITGSRRFARPLPLRSETARRSSIEYIDSMAGMLRRAKQITYAAEHYRHMLRRRLGQPYGLSPALDDEAFVAELAALRPIDRTALSRVLAELRRPDLTEAELLRLVAEADRIG